MQKVFDGKGVDLPSLNVYLQEVTGISYYIHVKEPKVIIHPSHNFNTIEVSSNNKVQGANMGPTWVLSVPDGPHGAPPMHYILHKTMRRDYFCMPWSQL